MGIFGIAKRGFGMLGKKSKSSKISPTITQPRQLKKTMEGIRSEFKQFGGTKAKTAVDRANIVRKKKAISRMEKLDQLKKKRAEGIKASKDVKKMVGSGQASKIGGEVFHKSVRERKFMGGLLGKDKKKDKKKEKSIKEKIIPKKKKDRLEELRKELK